MKKTFGENTQVRDIVKTSSLLIVSPIIGGAYALAFPFLGLAGLITAVRNHKERVPFGFHHMKLSRKSGY